ncbi:MAG: hypothetical protein H0U44_06640 [Flavisolibacter sp.]|nr:hypothetical protein [Flavisolibacter sp.]
MERNFTNENFESFLQQNADSLRMRPSEKVWKEISNKLNRRKRRIGFAIGSFLLAISTFGYFALEPGKNQVVTNESKTVAGNEQGTANQLSTPQESGSNTAATVIPMMHSPLSLIGSAERRDHQNELIPQVVNANGPSDLSENPATQYSPFSFTIVDNDPELKPGEMAAGEKTVSRNPYPQTIESVVNLKPKAQAKKVSFQFYFTPTLSYRRLSENKTFLRNQAVAGNASAASWEDVNNMVTHKPDMGFELGMAGKYPLTNKLKLRAGLQLNLNRYSIKAYGSTPAVTTIFLNTQNNGVDSVTSLTRHSNVNVNGAEGDWLENFYFQISAPVGLEWQLAGNNKVKFGVAATLQPTYVVGGKSYMITTDFKSYTQVPDLIRRLNMNTSFETFVEYSTGKLNWQVGPQVRYQLLSSFDSQYPVKEHLFNYGLKVGISLNNK